VLRELLLVGLARGQLEVKDVPLVQLHLLVVADVDLLGALGDEAHVVTDHEDASLELLEAALFFFQGEGKLGVGGVGRKMGKEKLMYVRKGGLILHHHITRIKSDLGTETREIKETYREGIDALHIEGICGLIEEEQVGLLVRNDGEDDSSLLARRELVHHLVLLVAGASVPAEERTDPLDGLLGHDLLLEKVQRGHRQVQLLLEVLSEAGNL
jgi:hypothetical protein